MTILYFLSVLIILGLYVSYSNSKKENNSPYLKVKKKLEEDLLQTDFAGDWKRRQEINLQLLWLKTIKTVESSTIFDHKMDKSEASLMSKLSLSDIRFPLQWKLEDHYCLPFSQEILSAYGKVLEENEYNGMFKPESILPVPKNWIRKSIYFTFDYFNLEKPIYQITDKDKRAANLNLVNSFLDLSFIDTGSIPLPKSGIENGNVGFSIKKSQKEHNELEDLNLIDWRSDTEWIVKGVFYAEKESYDYAFACYEHARRLNPDNKGLNPVLAWTYMYQGEDQYEKGEEKLAFENIRRAAELGDVDAMKWLKEHSEK